MIKIEAVAFTLESAIAAADNGAHRIELCASKADGGITPSFGTIAAAREILEIPIHVMIRPRGGDFVYTMEEFESMKIDIEICKKLGIDGVVFGILHSGSTVDKERCKELVGLAKPMTANFHRAFDRCSDHFKALEDVIECGFQRILTSGKGEHAMDSCGLLAELVRKAGDRIIIMPGGGVRKENIKTLSHITRATEMHTSAINDLHEMLVLIK